MGMPLTLVAADSHKLGAYRADPAGKPKGGVVVIQEIFGVNHHIRAVCDRVAEAGYVARGAGPVRPHRARLPVRLHAGRDRQGAQVRRGARLGRDAARHRCGDQGDQSPPARPPSWASAWAARSRSSPPAACPACPRRSATTAAASRASPTRSRSARPRCISARRTPTSRCRRWTTSGRSGRTARSMSIRAPITASIATSAAAITPKAQRIAWGRAMAFLEKNMKA